MQPYYDAGIHIPEIDLWLDPTRARERAVVTHAHSDHVRRNGRSLVTPATARLIAHRDRRNTRFEEAPLGRTLDFTTYQLTLLPAGHVLGSAQVLVEHRGVRLLYSGDLKLRPSSTAEPAETPHADILIVESTFGRPRYVFPPVEQVMEGIIAFCRDALAAGDTPVLLAYSLGKGQEVMARLVDEGFEVAAHPSTHGVCAIYEEFGVRFPPYGCAGSCPTEGKVVVCPPGGRNGPSMAGIRRPRTAYLSGWAMDRSTIYRARVDAAFPLSDHAGYDELIDYVTAVDPRRVYTVYGSAAPFAADLRARGYDARPFDGPMQLQMM